MPKFSDKVVDVGRSYLSMYLYIHRNGTVRFIEMKMCLIKYLFLSCFYCLAMTSWTNDNETDSQLVEGDIEAVLQGDNDTEFTDELHAPFSWNYNLWPDGTIPYAFDPRSTDFATLEIKHIEAMMVILSSKTCIKFIPVPNPNVYYVLIQFDSQKCSSKVGRLNQLNKRFQVLSLAHRCINENDILHEFMHLLGFLHEHNRPDRDNYVTINWENIIDGKNDSFRKQPSLHVTNVNKSYDYASVTHYPSTGSSKNQKETITAKQPGAEIKATGLSEMDVEKINELYNCAKKPKVTSSPLPELTTTTELMSIDDGGHFSEWSCSRLVEIAGNVFLQNGSDYVQANQRFYDWLTSFYVGLNFVSIFGRDTYALRSSYKDASCEKTFSNGTLKVRFLRLVPNLSTVGLNCEMFQMTIKGIYEQHTGTLRDLVFKTYGKLKSMNPEQYFLVSCDKKYEYNRNFQNLKIHPNYEDKICNVSLTDDIGCIGLKH